MSDAIHLTTQWLPSGTEGMPKVSKNGTIVLKFHDPETEKTWTVVGSDSLASPRGGDLVEMKIGVGRVFLKFRKEQKTMVKPKEVARWYWKRVQEQGMWAWGE